MRSCRAIEVAHNITQIVDASLHKSSCRAGRVDESKAAVEISQIAASVPRCISKKPNDLADIVYIVGRGGLCSWYVNRTESPTTEQETVVGTASIRVLSNNATAVVDTVCEAGRRARRLYRGEIAAAQ